MSAGPFPFERGLFYPDNPADDLLPPSYLPLHRSPLRSFALQHEVNSLPEDEFPCG